MEKFIFNLQRFNTYDSYYVDDDTDNRTEEQAEGTTLVLNFNTKSASERGMGSYTGLDLSDAKSPFNVIGNAHNFTYMTASTNGSKLEGGDANDQFYGSTGSDTFVKSGGVDCVNNFNVKRDNIQVSNDLFGTLIEALKDRGNNFRYKGTSNYAIAGEDFGLEIYIEIYEEEKTTTVNFGDGSKMILDDFDGE